MNRHDAKDSFDFIREVSHISLRLRGVHAAAALSLEAEAAKEAFRRCVPVPKKHRLKSTRDWHCNLVDKAKHLLSLRGVAFVEFVEDGLPCLQILTDPNGSPLNEFAHHLALRLGGLTFVYSPKSLLKPSRAKAHAKYQREANRILLPDEFVTSDLLADGIHHEVLHAVFNDFLRHGISSLFHGWIRAVNACEPMWASRNYRFRMSLEELAAHALNLTLIAGELARLGEVSDPRTRGRLLKNHLERVVKKTRTLKNIAIETEAVLARMIEELAADGVPSMLLFQVFEAPSGAKGRQKFLWTIFRSGNIELKVPLMRENDLERFHSGDVLGLKASLLERLVAQREVAVSLARLSMEARTLLEGHYRKLVRGKAGLDVLLPICDALCSPREVTMQYMLWGDSERVVLD